MISTITTKGQVTIPIAIRRQYGINPNDQVDFITEGDRIILVPVKTLQDFRGIVAGGGDSDWNCKQLRMRWAAGLSRKCHERKFSRCQHLYPLSHQR